MSTEAIRFRLEALEARLSARSILHTGLPGRIIYFKASMRRAIRKWRQYSEIMRTVQ